MSYHLSDTGNGQQFRAPRAPWPSVRKTIRQRTTSLGGTSLMVHKILALHLAAESRDNHASANSLRSRRDENVHVSKLGRD